MKRPTDTPGSTVESELKAFAKELVYMFSLVFCTSCFLRGRGTVKVTAVVSTASQASCKSRMRALALFACVATASAWQTTAIAPLRAITVQQQQPAVRPAMLGGSGGRSPKKEVNKAAEKLPLFGSKAPTAKKPLVTIAAAIWLAVVLQPEAFPSQALSNAAPTDYDAIKALEIKTLKANVKGLAAQERLLEAEAKAAKKAAVKEAAEALAAKKAAAARAKAEKDTAAAAAEALAAQVTPAKKAVAKEADENAVSVRAATGGIYYLVKIAGDDIDAGKKNKTLTALATLEADILKSRTTSSAEFFILLSRMDAKRAKLNEKGEAQTVLDTIFFGILLAFALKELALD